MTYEEARRMLSSHHAWARSESPRYAEAVDMAIESLKKQILKKPTPVILGKVFKDTLYNCPCCGDDWNANEYGSAMQFCWTCGQAIDWSEVEE